MRVLVGVMMVGPGIVRVGVSVFMICRLVTREEVVMVATCCVGLIVWMMMVVPNKMRVLVLVLVGMGSCRVGIDRAFAQLFQRDTGHPVYDVVFDTDYTEALERSARPRNRGRRPW
jgi:hypothetical protein